MLDRTSDSQVTKNTKKAVRQNKVLPLLTMPIEVLLDISDKLDILDRAALALTCKDIAAKLDAYDHLDWDGPGRYLPREPPFDAAKQLQSFFTVRLGKGWVSPSLDLKFCFSCGKFVRLGGLTYWYEKLKAEFVGKQGALSRHVETHFLRMNSYCGIVDQFVAICGFWRKYDEFCCPRCQAKLTYRPPRLVGPSTSSQSELTSGLLVPADGGSFY